MNAQNNHPEVDELVDWARGSLSRKRLREIRAHCRTCPACDLKLAKILVLRTKQRREMKRVARRRRQLQTAAAIVLLVGAGAVYLFGTYSSGPASELASLATTETIPESHVFLRFRGSHPASTDLYEPRLMAGMEALAQGDSPLAMEILEDLYSERPNGAETAAYLGVALYLTGDDSERTKALLSQGTSHMQPRVQRTATWYLANSCLRSGDLASAIEVLRTLDPLEINDRYGRSSIELLRRIQAARGG